MIHNATRLIINAFEENNFHFTLEEVQHKNQEVTIVHVNLPIIEGPLVYCNFISIDESSAVAVRVNGLFNHVPEHKWDSMIIACNKINDKNPFVKMVLDETDGEVSLRCDMPPFLPDEVIGELASLYFSTCAKTLNDDYHLLAEAMYSNSDDSVAPSRPSPAEIVNALAALSIEPITLDKQYDEELDF